MAYNYDKFDKSITEFVKENNIQSSTDYLLITSLKDKFTYVYEYKNGWELEYKWSSTVGKLSTPTIKGVFSVGIKYPAIGGNTSSVKYATNIVDDYYYHSIIYDDKGFNIKDDRLGVAISHGCIRLATSSAKWIYDNITEGILQFENLNLKLAVIQVLMYDLNLLKPRFDIYGFADEHKELEINTDSYTVIEPALNFFRELSIPREFAQYVEKIDMDGGNEVYMNIIPQWDGEDECFDLNNLTSSEIRQFPNLKKATIMSSNFDKVKEIFDAENIDVELL